MLINSISIYTSIFFLEITYKKGIFFSKKVITSGPKSKSLTVGMTRYSFLKFDNYINVFQM